MSLQPIQVKQQFSYDNPGWKGSGIPTIRSLISSAGRRIIFDLVHNFELREAWHIFKGFLFDIFYFHASSNQSRVKCPCCGWTGPAFLSTANWKAVTYNSRCPDCDSRSRHRGLTVLLPQLLDNLPGNELLYFAPEKILLDQLQDFLNLRVSTTDLYSVDVDYPCEDIQHLSFTASQFASIICNHVLEHVPDDGAAIAECARILQPGGLAVFTVPGDFPKQSTCEYKTPDSNGHYRHYGMDVLNKLQKFFEVQALNMYDWTDEEFKVRPYDYAFVCVRK